jgi:hypothetical protein
LKTDLKKLARITRGDEYCQPITEPSEPGLPRLASQDIALIDQPQLDPAGTFLFTFLRMEFSEAVVFVLEILKRMVQVSCGPAHLASYLTAFK